MSASPTNSSSPTPPPAPSPPSTASATVGATTTATTTTTSSSVERARKPPAPPRWPLLGNIPHVKNMGLLPFLEDSWRRHGDVFRVKTGMEMTVVAHPRGIEHILASHRPNYIKGVTYDGVRRIIGNGVLALEGHEWMVRRRLMQPHFHRAALAEMTATMVSTGRAFFDDLRKRLPDGGEIDAHQEMVRLTLDVVVAALFGVELADAAKVKPEALGHALELVGNRANGFSLPEWIPTAANRKHVETMTEVEGAVYRVIAAARARAAAGHNDGTLLAMLLGSKDEETGALLTDKELRDEVFTLFIAGHETTALTLTWLFTLLEGRDDVVSRMRDEVDRVLGGREPGFADVPKLVYTRMVVDEGLRLRGPVAMNARTAVADDDIMGFRVRAGDIVMPFFYGAHRHSDFWRDPQRFDPERFSEENSKGRDPWCYLPFSGGQRICIGNIFSLTETVLLLAMLVQRADFAMLPGQTLTPVALATVRPSGPVRVGVRWR